MGIIGMIEVRIMGIIVGIITNRITTIGIITIRREMVDEGTITLVVVGVITEAVIRAIMKEDITTRRIAQQMTTHSGTSKSSKLTSR